MSRQISLLYHDVLPEGAEASSSGFGGADADIYKLGESLFSEHLERIAELGADRVTALTEPTMPRERASRAPVLFTFDDGGVTADEPTARLLEERGWRGHFFVVTERLGRKGFLNPSQLVQMRKRGHLIGSHSHTHPAGFSRLSYERMVQEWRQSREILEKILGEPVWSASVPGGFYSREVARAAREAGYRVLFNSEPAAGPTDVDGLLVLGRYGIQHRTSAEAALRLARADRLPLLRQSLTWNAKKPLKKIGGPAWLVFRRWFFRSKA
jgi:peptidoglycan/xylan/chitin deacetylase (PgdA/CDA1 family)